MSPHASEEEEKVRRRRGKRKRIESVGRSRRRY